MGTHWTEAVETLFHLHIPHQPLLRVYFKVSGFRMNIITGNGSCNDRIKKTQLPNLPTAGRQTASSARDPGSEQPSGGWWGSGKATPKHGTLSSIGHMGYLKLQESGQAAKTGRSPWPVPWNRLQNPHIRGTFFIWEGEENSHLWRQRGPEKNPNRQALLRFSQCPTLTSSSLTYAVSPLLIKPALQILSSSGSLGPLFAYEGFHVK